jgi:hypothetical protein
VSAEAKSVRARLTFPEPLVGEPVVARLALDHGVIANIRRANVEDHTGWIVCELSGTPEAIDAGVAWLEGLGVKVDWLGGAVEG